MENKTLQQQKDDESRIIRAYEQKICNIYKQEQQLHDSSDNLEQLLNEIHKHINILDELNRFQ
ncbi:hypothetical protein IZY60_04400 [Lutibacter sp. B2]|nr:hypothetical protein [Lutibacter sp. B2]